MNTARMMDLDLTNKRIIIRVDLNVPMQGGKILHDARIKAILPTLELAVKKKAAVILLSHLGRPIEGHYNPAFSLKPVAAHLQKLLKQPIRFESDWLNGVDVRPSKIVLCENVRFLLGETENDPNLAKQMAGLCDVFIMDAFATAHRAQASTVGIAEYAEQVGAGPLLHAELEALSKALQAPKKPIVAVVGGAKISSKISILKSLVQKVDTLIVGGGLANTFIAAKGSDVGRSLYEPNLVSEALEIIQMALDRNINLIIPSDVVVATELSKDAETRKCRLNAVLSKEKILDMGPETVQRCIDALSYAATIIWNGPMGLFEYAAFAKGTEAIAQAIAQSSAYSIAGGGETLAAIDQFGVQGDISYVSTGGGAFLEYLAGKTLPGIAVLEERYRLSHL